MAEPRRQRSPAQGPLPRPEVSVAESVEDLARKSADELHAMLDDSIKNRLAAAEAHRLEALTSRRAQEAELLGIDFKVGDKLKARYTGVFRLCVLFRPRDLRPSIRCRRPPVLLFLLTSVLSPFRAHVRAGGPGKILSGANLSRSTTACAR